MTYSARNIRRYGLFERTAYVHFALVPVYCTLDPAVSVGYDTHTCLIYKTRHGKMAVLAFANSRGLGESALPRSPTRTYTIRCGKWCEGESSAKVIDMWPCKGAGHAHWKIYSTESSKGAFSCDVAHLYFSIIVKLCPRHYVYRTDKCVGVQPFL